MAPQRLSRSNTDGAHSTSQNALLLSMFDTLTYNLICRCRKLETQRQILKDSIGIIITKYIPHTELAITKQQNQKLPKK